MNFNKGISTLVGIIIIVVVAVILIGGVFAYQYWWAPWVPKEEAKNLQKSIACTEEAKVCPDGSAVGRTGPNCEFATCPDSVKGEEIVLGSNEIDNASLILKEENSGAQKIYLVDDQSKEEKLIATTSDVDYRHYHVAEYYNGNLYVIRRTGNSNYPSEDWIDELWKYGVSGKGVKLYQTKGIDFRVSPNENYLAVSDGNNLVFLNRNGEVLKEFIYEQDPYHLGPVKWSRDSTVFWAERGVTYIVSEIIKINTNEWKVDKYNVDLVSGRFDLNPNNAILVVNTFPLFLDSDDKEEWLGKENKVELYFYRLYDGIKIMIATSINKDFNAVWTKYDHVEYDNPNGSGRLRTE